LLANPASDRPLPTPHNDAKARAFAPRCNFNFTSNCGNLKWESTPAVA
jgi:hypothetical protein